MRKKIVAGNWKMNTTVKEGIQLASEIDKLLKTISIEPDKEVVIAPPFTHLTFIDQVIDHNKIKLSAQNCAAEDDGAFTGEVSAKMLKNLGCTYVIIGHSERRQYYNETSNILNRKINQAFKNDLIPIFCCGEHLEEREMGNHFSSVEKQISEVIFNLFEANFKKIVIAYEPVWAIGTGVTATKEEAQEMQAFIRKLVEDKYGKETAQDLSIIYGGSVKVDNACDLFHQPDVDGGLVGGASLNATGFFEIVKSI
jgi:triosephosphate isomerase